MSDYELFETREKHSELGCNGDLEVKVFRAKRRVEVKCKKCGRLSAIEKGKIVKDGALS